MYTYAYYTAHIATSKKIEGIYYERNFSMNKSPKQMRNASITKRNYTSGLKNSWSKSLGYSSIKTSFDALMKLTEKYVKTYKVLYY